jgi:tetratricopeptide (TPR) repeat protein
LLAQSLNLRERQGQAKSIIDQLLEKPEYQENPYIWELKAHIQNSLGEANDCIKTYQKSLNLAEPDQNMHMTYLRFGTMSALKDNTKLAKTILLKGVHAYKSLYMWLALGELCFQQGQYSEAETCFSQANLLDNTNPSIWGKLAVVSLVQENKTLAEQCYKWAIRFGLKPGPLLEEIKKLQEERGYGDPSFPRVPSCIPHEFYVKRLGLHNPLDIYRQALESPPVSRRSVLSMEEIRKSETWTKLPEYAGEQEEEEEEEEEMELLTKNSIRKISSGKSKVQPDVPVK